MASPRGRTGKPIHGILVSLGLTEVIVLVVRYFGGVKLGTSASSRRIVKQPWRLSLMRPRRECILTERIRLTFSYELMGPVMRIVKETEARVVVQDFRESCFLELEQRQGCAAELRSRLEQLYGVTLLPEAPRLHPIPKNNILSYRWKRIYPLPSRRL